MDLRLEKDSVDNNVASSGLEKKRTKASRACDQCRRKKIKCDYQDDANMCFGCKKMGEKCSFERIPLKRGPLKGCTRSRSSQRQKEPIARKRTSSQDFTDSGSIASNGLIQQHQIPLPPLHQYFPHSINNNTNGNLQFWKVPYHEFQYPRKSSIDSINSDTSKHNDMYSTSSTTSFIIRNQHNIDEMGQSSVMPPPMIRDPMQSQSPNMLQFPYSQFTMGTQQIQKQFHPQDTIINGSVSPRSPSLYSPKLVHQLQSPSQPKKRKRSGSLTKKKERNHTDSESLFVTNYDPKILITYGRISDVELIDYYYDFIHPNFPILPINKEFLTNDILLINTQPITEVHELNTYILCWFRNSLELLIRISLFDSGNDSEPLYNEHIFIFAINECFQKIVSIHPKFKENKDKISSKVKVIHLSTFVILNYILAFVGYNNSFVLSMSTAIFHEFEIYKLMNETSIKGYPLLFKRLLVNLIILDSLQSCCFGVPKLINLPLLGITKDVFTMINESIEIESDWRVEQDESKLKLIISSLELGELLCELCLTKCTIMNIKQKKLPRELLSIKNPNTENLSGLFAQFLLLKRKFVDKILLLPDYSSGTLPLVNFELFIELSEAVCDITEIIYKLLKLIIDLNPTNSITVNINESIPSGKGIISPFIIAIFCDLSNVIELIKNIPTCLIGCLMNIGNETGTQQLVMQLTECMNNIIQITSCMNILKPFKIFKRHTSNDNITYSKLTESLKETLMKTQDITTNSPEQVMLKRFVDISWLLLADEEFGWLT